MARVERTGRARSDLQPLGVLHVLVREGLVEIAVDGARQRILLRPPRAQRLDVALHLRRVRRDRLADRDDVRVLRSTRGLPPVRERRPSLHAITERTTNVQRQSIEEERARIDVAEDRRERIRGLLLRAAVQRERERREVLALTVAAVRLTRAARLAVVERDRDLVALRAVDECADRILVFAHTGDTP